MGSQTRLTTRVWGMTGITCICPWQKNPRLCISFLSFDVDYKSIFVILSYILNCKSQTFFTFVSSMLIMVQSGGHGNHNSCLKNDTKRHHVTIHNCHDLNFFNPNLRKIPKIFRNRRF